MTGHELVPEVVSAIAANVFPSSPVVEIVPMRGGLEAAVARLTIGGSGRPRRHVVLKRLGSSARHEAARYAALASTGVTPSLLGIVDHAGATYLFLERVRPAASWPWRDSAKTRLVLEQLARVHRLSDLAAEDDWNYETELLASACETVAVASDVASALPELDVRRELRTLRRVVAELPDARDRMNRVLGTALIHGDVHTANVMLRNRGGREEVVFLDWGRSRRGSPLEDVSSWLLSLRSWEPAAARDHDTLFRAYLTAAGHAPALTADVREAYWTAAASNVLAGALRYQLLLACRSGGKGRATAVAQAYAAFRVVRRAAERLPRA